MAILSLGAIFSVLSGSFAFISSLLGEAWARYFFILAGMFLFTGLESLTGFGAISSVVNFVVINVFGVANFFVTDFQLTIIVAMLPVIFFMLRLARGHNK